VIFIINIQHLLKKKKIKYSNIPPEKPAEVDINEFGYSKELNPNDVNRISSFFNSEKIKEPKEETTTEEITSEENISDVKGMKVSMYDINNPLVDETLRNKEKESINKTNNIPPEEPTKINIEDFSKIQDEKLRTEIEKFNSLQNKPDNLLKDALKYHDLKKELEQNKNKELTKEESNLFDVFDEWYEGSRVEELVNTIKNEGLDNALEQIENYISPPKTKDIIVNDENEQKNSYGELDNINNYGEDIDVPYQTNTQIKERNKQLNRQYIQEKEYPIGKDYFTASFSKNLSNPNLKIGVRNRMQVEDIKGKPLFYTMRPFKSYEETKNTSIYGKNPDDNANVLAVINDKVKFGKLGDFKNDKNVKVSTVNYMPNVESLVLSDKNKFSKNINSRVLLGKKKGGGSYELGIGIGKNGKGNKMSNWEGGHLVVKIPNSDDIIVLHGSGKQLYNAFEEIKKDYKVDALDIIGTDHKAFSIVQYNKEGKVPSKYNRWRDNTNSSGGNYLYYSTVDNEIQENNNNILSEKSNKINFELPNRDIKSEQSSLQVNNIREEQILNEFNNVIPQAENLDLKSIINETKKKEVINDNVNKLENKNLVPQLYPELTNENKYKSWEDVKNRTVELNKMKQIDIITEYNKNSNEEYLVLDKSTGKMHLFKGDKPIATYQVGVGANIGDEQTKTVVGNGKVYWDKGNKMTGAGIYTVSNINPAHPHYGNKPTWNFINENGIEVPMAIHPALKERIPKIKSGDTRVSNGCINGLCNDIEDLYKRGYGKGKKLYILPDDPNNQYKIRNGKLIFTSSDENVNRSVNTLNYKPVKVEIDHRKFSNDKRGILEPEFEQRVKDLLTYGKTLENNKKKIMQLSQVDGDVMNEIIKTSFGIYGVESNYGDRHTFLENLVRGLTGNRPDTRTESLIRNYIGSKENSSLGLTQVVWSQLEDETKNKLKEVGITDISDFDNPEKAAIGTMLILAERYRNQVQAKNPKLEDIENILPTLWNKADNYTQRVKKAQRYMNLKQEE